MGLSASMWTSVSGLISHGNKMNVVGNNIANVSTIGFKSQRMDFSDALYLGMGSASGPTQVGAGVSTYAVIGDFSQGTLESTNSVTDIALDGEGFFKVRQPNSEQCFYTRAGDFYFNADRQLQNPEGYRLQGWKINNSNSLTFKNDSVNLGKNEANESAFQGTGTPVDIILDSWYLEPQRTSNVHFTMGLTSDNKSDRSTSTSSPMTALFDQWDARKEPPMADTAYATSSSIKVYDEGGTAHTMTVYYDQVATQSKDADGNVIYSIDGLPAGYTMYEYVVTVPPAEDMRSYGGTTFNEDTNEFDGNPPTTFYNDPVQGTNKKAGVMMTGHLIFDAAGNLVNQTAYSYGATADPGNKDQCNQDPAVLSSWQATKFSSNGLPVFCANFTGQPLANSVSEKISATRSQAQDFLIELDFGLRTAGDWGYAGSLEDLKGIMVDPIVNTETRINLGSKTEQTDVKGKLIPGKEGRIQWTAEKSITGAEKSYTTNEQPKVSVALPKTPSGTAYYEILVNSKGPETQWVNKDSRKPCDPSTDKDAVLCLLDTSGQPVMHDGKLLVLGERRLDASGNVYITDHGGTRLTVDVDGSGTQVDVTLDNIGVYAATNPDKVFYKDGSVAGISYTVEETAKVIPGDYLDGEFTKVVGDETEYVNLQQDAYAEVYGVKYYVFFDDDGIIQGLSRASISDWVAEYERQNPGATEKDITLGAYNLAKDAFYGNTNAALDKVDQDWLGKKEYGNERVKFPKAEASRKIDYNNDVSTYDDPVRAENATKAGSSSFITQDAGQNGYASGVLSGTNITADGVVYGYYDNGETVPLYQIALYDFHNKQGLRREGGNLYAQTKESGEARQGVAGEAGFGNVKAYNIEGSNVDLSREFVNMITTQRGFQANSKGITTVDTMLETVIGMKR